MLEAVGTYVSDLPPGSVMIPCVAAFALLIGQAEHGSRRVLPLWRLLCSHSPFLRVDATEFMELF